MEGQCLHSEGRVEMLQSQGSLIVVSTHLWKDSDSLDVDERVFFFGHLTLV